jgi:peptidase A4-like protein
VKHQVIRRGGTVAARRRKARNWLWLLAAAGCVVFAMVASLTRPSSPARAVRVADETGAVSPGGGIRGGPGGLMTVGPRGSLSAGPGSPASQGGQGTDGSQGGQGTDGSQGGQGTDGSQGGAANAAATSENWSGYAAAGTPGTPGTFTSVSSSWTEPAVTCSAQQAFSSFWVGLDGDGTQSVEQTGTEADCNNGAASYQGWFEMFPNAPVFYDSPVAPGDTMSASVVANGGGAFTLTLSDQTQGWTQTTDQTSTTAQLGSAEIIAEAPSDTNSALPLSNFGTVNFADAMINNAALTGAGPTELTMVSAAGATEATPSAITNGDDFSVIWDSTGTASSPAATSPPAPARPGP